jgi:gamma-glutamyltranspeptidase/glutathione hydrolase
VLHTMIYTLDLGYDLAEAVAMPRAYPWTTEPVVQVEDGFDPEALAGLRRRGYTLLAHPPVDMYFGGVSAILVTRDGRLIGVADPRRDGGARGY